MHSVSSLIYIICHLYNNHSLKLWLDRVFHYTLLTGLEREESIDAEMHQEAIRLVQISCSQEAGDSEMDTGSCLGFSILRTNPNICCDGKE